MLRAGHRQRCFAVVRNANKLRVLMRSSVTKYGRDARTPTVPCRTDSAAGARQPQLPVGDLPGSNMPCGPK